MQPAADDVAAHAFAPAAQVVREIEAVGDGGFGDGPVWLRAGLGGCELYQAYWMAEG